MSDWTDGRVKSFITSVLRGGYRRWPPRYETLKEACVGKKINEKTGRQALHYQCASCKKDYPTKDVNVDHIDPVVSVEDGFINWDEYIKRLFCGSNNLQVLCSKCHDKKTKLEKEGRQVESKKSRKV